MGSDPGQVAARRQLGAELQRYRKASGLTGQEVADALGWHQSKVSRIEAARNLIRVEDVSALLEVLSIPASERDSVMTLAETNVGEPGSWRNSSRVGLTRRQQDYIALEASAAVIAHYQPVLLPGYLQTPEYARSVIEMADARDVDRAVGARLSRRATLTAKNAPRYRLLLMEAAVRWRPVDDAEMAAQLLDLAELSERKNVDLRIVPYDRKQSGFIQHPVVIMDFRDETKPEAYIETTVQDVRVSDERGMEILRRHFNRVRTAALSREESTALLRKLARDLG